METARRKPIKLRTVRRAGLHPLLWPVAGALLAAACNTPPVDVRISVGELETGAQPPLRRLGTFHIANLAALGGSVTPLGESLALVEIRSPAEWEALQIAAPQLGTCPDFSRGSVVGVATWIGRPLEDRCPIQIEDVRESRGAGMLALHFIGGTFLPDGTAYLSLVQAAGVQTVLIVDIDGVRQFPQTSVNAEAASDPQADYPLGV